jgi:pyruvate/2-oxoglutarate/acetoin dehydrogenase E1 component
VLYRAAVEDVPVKEYTLPLGKADVLVAGKEGHVIMAFRVVVFNTVTSFACGMVERRLNSQCGVRLGLGREYWT